MGIRTLIQQPATSFTVSALLFSSMADFDLARPAHPKRIALRPGMIRPDITPTRKRTPAS